METKIVNSKTEWENFISGHPEANFLQSWYWGEFHKAIQNDIQRTGFYKKGVLVGVMLSIVEHAKRGRYLTVPGGPIIDWRNKGHVSAFLSRIKDLGSICGCAFIRVRPQIVRNEFSEKLFSHLGFVSAPAHLHAELTSELNINENEEMLLSNMRKSTRNEIKKAIKMGIKVTKSTDPKTIRKFYREHLVTAKRQRFVPFPYKYLYEQFKIFAKNNCALLYKAEFGKKLLAQAFIIFYGSEAVYHYGSSTDSGRKYPGAYLIQWEAIKEAKKRGIRRYNFWGVSPVHKASHRFAGLSLFKRGFGGYDVEYLPAQDLVLRKIPYLINYFIEALRKNLRGL